MSSAESAQRGGVLTTDDIQGSTLDVKVHAQNAAMSLAHNGALHTSVTEPPAPKMPMSILLLLAQPEELK
jgi:hypothetical protein